MRNLLLCAISVAACGVYHDIEEKITIDQGVYGLLVANNIPAANQDVTVFAAGGNTAFATMPSDGDGVYQIDLAPGDYTLCTFSCTPITVPAASTVRYDWTSGPGGGHWDDL